MYLENSDLWKSTLVATKAYCFQDPYIRKKEYLEQKSAINLHHHR